MRESYNTYTYCSYFTLADGFVFSNIDLVFGVINLDDIHLLYFEHHQLVCLVAIDCPVNSKQMQQFL